MFSVSMLLIFCLIYNVLFINESVVIWLIVLVSICIWGFVVYGLLSGDLLFLFFFCCCWDFFLVEFISEGVWEGELKGCFNDVIEVYGWDIEFLEFKFFCVFLMKVWWVFLWLMSLKFVFFFLLIVFLVIVLVFFLFLILLFFVCFWVLIVILGIVLIDNVIDNVLFLLWLEVVLYFDFMIFLLEFWILLIVVVFLIKVGIFLEIIEIEFLFVWKFLVWEWDFCGVLLVWVRIVIFFVVFVL